MPEESAPPPTSGEESGTQISLSDLRGEAGGGAGMLDVWLTVIP